MKQKTRRAGQIVIGIIIMAFATPVFSSGEDSGQDWYCAKSKEHAQYINHRKLHIDHEAEVAAALLEQVYSDKSLSAEQRHIKTVNILKLDLSKVSLENWIFHIRT